MTDDELRHKVNAGAINPTDPTWMHCDCEHCKGRRAFENTKGITREMAITALVNLHHSIRGEDCPREAAIGCATSAVQQLKKERDELREQREEYLQNTFHADGTGPGTLSAVLVEWRGLTDGQRGVALYTLHVGHLSATGDEHEVALRLLKAAAR